jgi:hypothetical protein
MLERWIKNQLSSFNLEVQKYEKRELNMKNAEHFKRSKENAYLNCRGNLITIKGEQYV